MQHLLYSVNNCTLTCQKYDTWFERKHFCLFCTAMFSCPPRNGYCFNMICCFLFGFFYLPCDFFFVLLYESLFIACETISYVVLYLFTVHIRCTEKLGFYTLCSACLQYLKGPETQRTNFFALVHEHTLTLKTPIPRSYKSKEENRTFLVMIPIFVLPSPFDLFHFPVSV